MYARDGKVCTPTEGPIRAESVHTRQIDVPSRRPDERTDPGSRIDGQGPAPDNATPESVGSRKDRRTSSGGERARRQETTRRATTNDPETAARRTRPRRRRIAGAPARHNRVALAAWRLVLGGRQPAARPRAGARGSSARAGAELGSRSSAPARAEQAGRRTRHGGPRRDAAAAPGRDQMKPDRGQGRRRNGARKRRPGGAERAATDA